MNYQESKVKYIDGLKGICCLMVCLGHMSALLLPALYFGDTYQLHSDGERFFFTTPLNIFYNSSSGLICFLVLSGFVIPLKAFRKNEVMNVFSKWIGKYFRFMPMAVIGTMLAWIIMKLDLVYSYKMVDISFSNPYATYYNNFSPAGIFNIYGPLVDGAIKTMLKSSNFDSPIGTLSYIWLFSLVLLLFTKYLKKVRIRRIIYGLVAIGFIVAGQFVKYELFYFAAMMMGYLLCDICYNTDNKSITVSHQITKSSLWVLAFILISIPTGHCEGGFYTRFLETVRVNTTVFWIVGWTILVFVLINSSHIQKLLECGVFQWLGSVSFAFYVIHWPLAVSLTCFMAKSFFEAGMNYVLSALLAMLISLPVILGLAWLVERFIYQNLRKALIYVGNSLKKLVSYGKIQR